VEAVEFHQLIIAAALGEHTPELVAVTEEAVAV